MKQTDNRSYNLNDNGEFTITGYNSAKPFSSFFPGIAGISGVPMWIFYVNRGQGICGMGTQDKDHPIMEFMPANMAYNQASRVGFRTFLKFISDSDNAFYEPFQNNYRHKDYDRVQKMIIAPASLSLEEANNSLGLFFKVEYAPVPEDNYAGIIRTLTIENTSDKKISFEGLDGLPVIVPYGVDNFCLKNMRRTIEAFVEVENLDKSAPFFKSKVEPDDRPDVVKITRGNFYFGFDSNRSDSALVQPVVDPAKIFGQQLDFSYPAEFLKQPFENIATDQVINNQMPSAMGLLKADLEPGDKYSYTSIIGHAFSVAQLNELIPLVANSNYTCSKSDANRELINQLTQHNLLNTDHAALNHYARQNFLDNTMRGGFPFTFEGNKSKTTLYLFSRKHGDMERDYNDFRLTPTKFSQGNGNFRDINQNRRSDLFFNPEVGADNVECFYNLIQPDGFNPLVLKEISFKAIDHDNLLKVLSSATDCNNPDLLADFIKTPFTPGELIAFLDKNRIKLQVTPEKFIGLVAEQSEKITATDYGESFWIDHWTYNLDLLENYRAIYPDNFVELLFNRKDFTFYDSAELVQPRDEKFVLWNNKPIQLGAILIDEEKEALIRSRTNNQNLLRTKNGEGEIYQTTLLVKIISLIVNKIASLDPEGIGVEMEAGKPAWYDALNGLPGQFGSSVSETLEIKRHILYLLEMFEQYKIEKISISLYQELHEFLTQLKVLLDGNLNSFEYWDQSNQLKENYRRQIARGISGEETTISFDAIIAFLNSALAKVELGIVKAIDNSDQIIKTYYRYEITEYETIKLSNGMAEKTNREGYTCIKPLKFKAVPLPLFLEGPVHYMRSHPERPDALAMVKKIRASALYDKKLNMYKVNAPLEEESMEIGRARVFSPGWLENESIWLHMEYKYILELLRNGFFDQYYDDFKKVTVPFMNPANYGRSILENSSFIASSAYPDSSLHGNGFVARLSGATAEFIHMLLLMTVGAQPFRLDENNDLIVCFEPALPEWLFTTKIQTITFDLKGTKIKKEIAENSLSFMFLGTILVTFHNPKRKATFGADGVKPISWKITDHDGDTLKIESNIIEGEMAHLIRKRKIESIDIELG